MAESTINSLVLLAAAAVLAPLLAHRFARWLLIPSVVLEIALGVLIGPQVLHWASEDDVITALSQIGLATLMCMAGYEIDFATVRGRPLKRAAIGWFISLGLALVVAAIIHGFDLATIVIGLCLTTTALGTILPILQDSGALKTPFGPRIMAIGAVGEFAPIVAMSLFLTTDQPLHTSLLLLVFLVISFAAIAMARRPRSELMHKLLGATLGTSAQLAVRITILLLFALVWVAAAFGLDFLLGAFTAGIVLRLAVATIDPHVIEAVESKLEAVGYGFLIPIFFIVSGMGFDIKSLGNVTAIAKMLAFLILLLLVRGLPTLLLNKDDPQRKPLALMASAGLPLIVAITSVGVERGAIDSASAAALVAAGALSVLIYPMLAMSRLRRPSK